MSTDISGAFSDPFISSLVSFVAADSFQRKFEKFFFDHAEEFSFEEEHQHKFFELYTRFHEMFEGQLEEFCRIKELSLIEFMTRCREAIVEDPKAKQYIDILLGSVEYETFVKLMKIMKPISQMRKQSQAESKSSQIDPSSTLAKSRKVENDDPSEEKQSSPPASASDSKSVHEREIPADKGFK